MPFGNIRCTGFGADVEVVMRLYAEFGLFLESNPAPMKAIWAY
jgi:hypothetical protein